MVKLSVQDAGRYLATEMAKLISLRVSANPTIIYPACQHLTAQVHDVVCRHVGRDTQRATEKQ